MCKKVQPKIKYKTRKNILKMIFLNSFSKINFKPQEIKVNKIKNELDQNFVIKNQKFYFHIYQRNF